MVVVPENEAVSNFPAQTQLTEAVISSVSTDGQLSNIKILRGIGAGCDEEAIRVLQRSPKWKPGIQNKQNVRVAYTLPISFSLP